MFYDVDVVRFTLNPFRMYENHKRMKQLDECLHDNGIHVSGRMLACLYDVCCLKIYDSEPGLFDVFLKNLCKHDFIVYNVSDKITDGVMSRSAMFNVIVNDSIGGCEHYGNHCIMPCIMSMLLYVLDDDVIRFCLHVIEELLNHNDVVNVYSCLNRMSYVSRYDCVSDDYNLKIMMLLVLCNHVDVSMFDSYSNCVVDLFKSVYFINDGNYGIDYLSRIDDDLNNGDIINDKFVNVVGFYRGRYQDYDVFVRLMMLYSYCYHDVDDGRFIKWLFHEPFILDGSCVGMPVEMVGEVVKSCYSDYVDKL